MVVKIGLGVFLSFIFETLIFDYRFLLKLSLKNNCFLNVSLVYFLIKRINKKNRVYFKFCSFANYFLILLKTFLYLKN